MSLKDVFRRTLEATLNIFIKCCYPHPVSRTERATLDAVAAAIASAPRRALIERLSDGPATMTQLTGVLGASMPAALRHLHVLTDAGIVERTKMGRAVTFALRPGSLAPLQEWALSARLMWASQLDRFAEYAARSAAATPTEEDS